MRSAMYANYSPLAWYWQMPGDTGHVFSSAAAALVPVSDMTYQEWLSAGQAPAILNPTIPSAQAYSELFDVLSAQAPSAAQAVGIAWVGAGYLTPKQVATVAVAAGLILTSTGTPTVSGTYPLDPDTRSNVSSVALYIRTNSSFPAGLSALQVPDISGIVHSFSSTALYLAFATAMGNLVTAIDEGSLSGSITMPPNTVTIA